MTLEAYLSKHYSPSTVKSYLHSLKAYLQTKNPETASYSDVMAYLGKLRSRKNDISVDLYAIKSYYSYLVAIGARKDHPAASIILKDQKRKDIQLQDLFSTEELEMLLERSERYPILKHRNRLLMSLLIYQGLTAGEIKRLTLKNINLEKGNIYIEGSRKTNGRSLKLQSSQLYDLIQYIEKDRPILLKTTTEKLFIGKTGKPESGEGISYLVSTYQYLFPSRRLTSVTIRQSVIYNLLKSGKDLRWVQVFAGHKYSSTTEQYKQNEIEELKKEIIKLHPLG